MNPTTSWARIALAIFGIVVGAVLLFLSFRGYSLAQVKTALFELNSNLVATGLLLYLCAICIRTLRWHGLLRGISGTTLFKTFETLLVGYAVNNSLPGRLGEVFRADYAKRRFGLTRSATLGTIVVERGADALGLVCFFWLGVALFVSSAPYPKFIGSTDYLPALALASLGVMIAIAAIFFAYRHRTASERLPEWASRRLASFAEGLSTLHPDRAVALVVMTMVVWSLEAASLWMLVAAAGVELTVPEIMMLQGIAAFSTLIPTAPGYVGSYQFAFVTMMAALGHDALAGLVSATAAQLVFFGTVTLVGLAALVLRSAHSLRSPR